MLPLQLNYYYYFIKRTIKNDLAKNVYLCKENTTFLHVLNFKIKTIIKIIKKLISSDANGPKVELLNEPINWEFCKKIFLGTLFGKGGG